MLVVKDLKKIPAIPKKIALTLGNFDGVHLGHQKLLAHVKEKGAAAVLTFSNHPAEILAHRPPAPALCTPAHKLQLLEQAGCELVLMLPFTAETAQEPYDLFVKKIHESLPFSFLILGQGAAFGHKQLGNETRVKALEKTFGFAAEYRAKVAVEDQIISSGRIRQEIEKGALNRAAALLGRPFSIYQTAQNGHISGTGLCLPPSGTYQALARTENQEVAVRVQIERSEIRITPALSGTIELIFKEASS